MGVRSPLFHTLLCMKVARINRTRCRPRRAVSKWIAVFRFYFETARQVARGAVTENEVQHRRCPARRLIGMSPSSCSPLSNPSFGLAWSNRLAPNDVLVRAAIKHGAFHLLLEAALGHGLQFVERQLEIMQSDEDAALSDHALSEVRRKLANIARGIAAAELASQDVMHPEAERPSAGLGLREGRK